MDYVAGLGQGGVIGGTQMPAAVVDPNQQPRQPSVPAAAQPAGQNFDQVFGSILSNRQMHQQTNADIGALLAQRESISNRMGFARTRRQQAAIKTQLAGIDSQIRQKGQAARFGDTELATALKYAQFQNREAQDNLKHSETLMQHQHDANIATGLANRTARIANGTLQVGSDEDAAILSDLATNNHFASKGSMEKLQHEAVRHDTAKQRQFNVLNTELAKTYGITGDQFAAIPPGAVKAGRMVDAKGKPVEPDARGVYPPGSVFSNQYAEAASGPITEVNLGGQPVHMATADYNKYRRAFGTAATQGAAQQPQVTADQDAQAQGFRNDAQRQYFRQTGKLDVPTATTEQPEATSTPALNPPVMPQIGDKRSINGVQAEWDGKGWKPVK